MQRGVHGRHSFQDWLIKPGLIHGRNCLTKLLVIFAQRSQRILPGLVTCFGQLSANLLRPAAPRDHR